MGLSFRGADSFLAVPGLTVWVDSQKLIELDEYGGVIAMRDLSSNGYLFTSLRTAIDRRARITNGLLDLSNYVGSNPSYDVLSAPGENFKFLHDGSPYLYYDVRSMVLPANGVGGNTMPSNFADISLSGIQTLIVTVDSVPGRFQYIVRTRDAGTLSINNSVTVNNMKITNGELLVTKHKCYGIGSTYGLSENNFYFDDVRIGGANYSHASTHNPHRRFGLTMTWTQGPEFRNGLRACLLYNMTGFTGPEIDIFDTRIRGLIFQEYGI